jgi:hypothetical protein
MQRQGLILDNSITPNPLLLIQLFNQLVLSLYLYLCLLEKYH